MRWLALSLALLGCDEPEALPGPGVVLTDALVDGGEPDSGAMAELDGGPLEDAAPADAAPAPLTAAAGPDRYALVGEVVHLDGAGSTGAVAWQWDFGDGRRQETPGPDPAVEVTYEAPGRYRATLSAIGADGARRTDVAIISVTWPLDHRPRHSGPLITLPDGALAAAVTDAHLIVELAGDAPALTVRRRTPTCLGPRTLAALGDRLAVACPGAGEVWVHGDGPPERLAFHPAARPLAVLAMDGALYVGLGVGEVVRFEGDPLAEVGRWALISDLRGLAALPDGRLAASRWRSPDGEGRLAVLDPEAGAVDHWRLAYDPQGASDTEIGGVPGYLDQLVVSPTGREMAVPSLQANVRHGLAFDGEVPAFDTVLRAVVSFVDPRSGEEDFGRRKQFDGRGLASAAVYSPRGDFLFVAMRGSRVVERLDRLGQSPSGTLIESGFAVEGLEMSPDGRWLFGLATLSRELRIWDALDLRAVPLPARIVPLLQAEPLEAELLLGKQLFNDSFDPRLGREGYLACAHCHLDGDSDRLVWDFTARGEGLRNTISLLGRAGLGHGPVHWSANFDEIQDFEHDIRGPFGGEGLMSDAEFAEANTPLGPPKAGRSADLDALAVYVASLDTPPASPARGPEGDLGEPARRGRALYASLGCGACHAGPSYTDSGFVEPGSPLLHDVGTLRPTSGGRLGGPLTGIDTPTLLGLWDSAPYLHDGSAPTLRAVLVDRNPEGLHGETADLSPEALADLEAFLLSL